MNPTSFMLPFFQLQKKKSISIHFWILNSRSIVKNMKPKNDVTGGFKRQRKLTKLYVTTTLTLVSVFKRRSPILRSNNSYLRGTVERSRCIISGAMSVRNLAQFNITIALSTVQCCTVADKRHIVCSFADRSFSWLRLYSIVSEWTLAIFSMCTEGNKIEKK